MTMKHSGERIVAVHMNKRMIEIINHHIAVFEWVDDQQKINQI